MTAAPMPIVVAASVRTGLAFQPKFDVVRIAGKTRAPDQVRWFRAHLLMSLDLIEHAASDRGASTLVDDLETTSVKLT